MEFLKNYFVPNSILDIGANTGEFYKKCLIQFPTAEYFLIEANPLCEEHLQNLNVKYAIGVFSDIHKETSFYQTKNATCGPTTTGNSVYREKTSYYNDKNVIVNKATTTTLNSLFSKNTQFDFIKLDVQGSELDIIRGGVDLVKNAKGILMEVSLIEYNQNAPLVDEAYIFMDSLGFTPELIVDVSHNPETNEHVQNDVFFINKNL
jgi:FkbM family methyltransferase